MKPLSCNVYNLCVLTDLVFVLNHASPDDFQPLSLREMHTELAANFQGAKVNIAGE